MLKRTLLFVLLLYAYSAFAQTKTVSGTVFSADDHLPLPGASVKVKGGTQSTTTDANGTFKIQVRESSGTLIISFIGLKSREVNYTDKPLSISLENDSKLLNEVVIAYGVAKKGDLTGSVSQLNKTQLEKTQVSSISKALQGSVAGVQSVSASGQPGTDASIRIRGIGSINASSEPLYVVDGAPYNGNLSSIATSDIESISVLKDAASSALYGSRGANGVIIITTKQGKKNAEPVIDLQVTHGLSTRAVKDYKQINTNQYFELYWEALRNKELTQGGAAAANAAATASGKVIQDLGINPYGPAFPQPVGLDGKIVPGATPLWNDDWQKGTQQTGRRTEALLNISGGGTNNQYFVSGGYLNDQGIAIGSGFKRYSARANVSIDAKKWLKVGVNLSGATSKQDYPTSEDSKTSNIINFGRAIPSFYPIYVRNTDGSYKLDAQGNSLFDYGDYRPSSASPRYNLIGTTDLDKAERLKDDASFRTFIEAKIIPGLKFKSSFNLDYSNQNNHNYTNPTFGGDASIHGSVSKSNSRTLSWTLSNLLTYEKEFGEGHHLNLLAGQESYQYNWRTISGSRQNFVLPGLYEPVAASQLNDFSGYSIDYGLQSYFGRAEYDYLKRYFFSASIRTDGSSRFSPSTRWGTFWSLGASWKLSEEEFLKPIDWLSNLSLKASYGAQGNDNIGTYYAYAALYTIANNLGEGGVYPVRLPTPNLKWETSLNTNIGLDFGILRDRISGSVEYFQRKSKDLLYSRPLAPSTGYASIDENIGALKNSGFEFQLQTTPVLTKDFRWSLDLNLTHYKNVITDLPQKEIISGNKKLMVGRSINDFYIREWAGVDPATGKPQWYQDQADGTKTKTSVYGDASLYYSGSALPDFYGGVTNTFRYKDVELSFLVAYSVGGKVLDGDITSGLHTGNLPGRAWNEEILNRWTPDNRNTDVPRLTTDDTNWTSTSTRFLYDASYLRLKNLNLSYTLPKATSKLLGLNSLRVFLQGENLLTWYKHKGMDPEQTISGNTYFRYPAIRTVSAGIKVSL